MRLERNDEKPEPHLPRTQERNGRVQSALRKCNLKRFDVGDDINKSFDERS